MNVLYSELTTNNKKFIYLLRLKDVRDLLKFQLTNIRGNLMAVKAATSVTAIK
jgi:hypothetical protein